MFDLPFKYQLQKSRRRSTSISIKITPEEGVIVTAPIWAPKLAIHGFLLQKQDWIQKQLARLDTQTKEHKASFEEGSQHLLFGKHYPLKYQVVPGKHRPELSLKDNHFLLQASENYFAVSSSHDIEKVFLQFYMEKGIEEITAKVNHYSGQLHVDYSTITIKKVSSIWGSCSGTNALSFNRKLILAPHAIVDYVVIHEVCHMVHRDHSSRFWALVSRFDPSFREHRHWLKINHQLLNI